MTKRCGRCRVEKPVDLFHRRRGGYQTSCKACRRAYDAGYHRATRAIRIDQKRERHAEFVAWYLASVADLCRKNNCRRVLDEIAKCEVVCANCHAVRTFQRQRGVAQLG